jgi:hypothetical protein
VRIRTYSIWLLAITAAWAGSPADEWKKEIEQTYGVRILIEPVRFDYLRNSLMLSPRAEDPESAQPYLTNPSFLKELSAAHALTVNTADRHLIFINLMYSDQFRGAEDGLLEHELGHIWLTSRGLASLPFKPGPRACVAIHASDIPAHVLIRAETERRGSDWRKYLVSNAKIELKNLQSGSAAADLSPCQKLATVSQWLDLRLGITASGWDGYARLDGLYAERYPALLPVVTKLEEYLKQGDFGTPAAYAVAVEFVREELDGVWSD